MKIRLLLPAILLMLSFQLSCKGKDSTLVYRVMFWNLENYFDPFDDSLTNDNEYLPDADRHWTWKKFEQKRNNIYKVIMAAGTPEPPAIIGFAEAENRFVLTELIRKTPLQRYEYGIVHHDSPDSRGIDAALIYRKDLFTLLKKDFFPVAGDDENFRTREIVYVKGIIGNDTLHCFVNHWPSRSGGQTASDDKRCKAGRRLRAIIDSVQQVSPKAKILCMGDFNDTPTDASLVSCLHARCPAKNENVSQYAQSKPQELINLAGMLLATDRNAGSHKFQGEWSLLDQIIVTASLLNNSHGIRLSQPVFTVLQAPFLLIKDEQDTGKKPHRTYNGMRYEGGFSDHLPVFTDLVSAP